MSDAKSEQLPLVRSLWTTVDNPCGKPLRFARARLNAFEEDKSSSIGAVVDALLDAVAFLAARVDGLDYAIAELLAIVDAPLSPAESIERLRELREQL